MKKKSEPQSDLKKITGVYPPTREKVTPQEMSKESERLKKELQQESKKIKKQYDTLPIATRLQKILKEPNYLSHPDNNLYQNFLIQLLMRMSDKDVPDDTLLIKKLIYQNPIFSGAQFVQEKIRRWQIEHFEIDECGKYTERARNAKENLNRIFPSLVLREKQRTARIDHRVYAAYYFYKERIEFNRIKFQKSSAAMKIQLKGRVIPDSLVDKLDENINMDTEHGLAIKLTQILFNKVGQQLSLSTIKKYIQKQKHNIYPFGNDDSKIIVQYPYCVFFKDGRFTEVNMKEIGFNFFKKA